MNLRVDDHVMSGDHADVASRLAVDAGVLARMADELAFRAPSSLSADDVKALYTAVGLISAGRQQLSEACHR
jgi:hypothetical protein